MTEIFKNSLTALIELRDEYLSNAEKFQESNPVASRNFKGCAAEIDTVLANHFNWRIVEGRGIVDDSCKSTWGHRSTLIEQLS